MNEIGSRVHQNDFILLCKTVCIQYIQFYFLSPQNKPFAIYKIVEARL